MDVTNIQEIIFVWMLRNARWHIFKCDKYSNMTNIEEIILDLLEECEVAGADIYEVADDP